MLNKSSDLLQHLYAVMVNDDGDYELLTNDTMSITDDDYEPSN